MKLSLLLILISLTIYGVAITYVSYQYAAINDELNRTLGECLNIPE